MEKKHIKTFDSLRLIALLLVFLYHLIPNNVPNGYFGVNIFFVLSGFLCICKIDVSKKKENALIKIKSKFFKLSPPMLIMIISVSVMMVLFFESFLSAYPIEAISSAFYINNYSQIVRRESYFEAMNNLKPLTNLWALSLEMQFYILFYLLIYPFYNERTKKMYLFLFAILTILSICFGFHLSNNNADVNRIYYSMPTRFNAFSIGMIFAICADEIKNVKNSIIWLIKAFKITIIFILIYVSVVNYIDNKHIVQMMLLYSLFTGILVFVSYIDDISSKDNGDFLYNIIHLIIEKSYIIYLVHYPIIVFTNRLTAHKDISTSTYVLIVIFTTIIITEIIYVVWKKCFKINSNCGKKIMMLLVVLFLFMFNILNIKNDNEIDDDVINETLIEGIYDTNGNLIISNEEFENENLQKIIDRISTVNLAIGGETILASEEYIKNRNMKITIIGDSITKAASKSIKEYMPNAIINAEGNRQLRNTIDTFYNMKENNELLDVLVVALGTNSDHDIRIDILEEIYQNIDNRPMILLTIVIPYMMQEKKRNNDILEFASSHKNCYIADWNGIMKTHEECFKGDQIHPKGIGIDAYSQIIFKAAMGLVQEK